MSNASFLNTYLFLYGRRDQNVRNWKIFLSCRSTKSCWRVANRVFGGRGFQQGPSRGFAPPVLARFRRPWGALWKTPPPENPLWNPLVMSRQFESDPDSFLKHRSDRSLCCSNFYKHAIVEEYGPDRCIPVRLFADYAKLDQQVSNLNVQWLIAARLPKNLTEVHRRCQWPTYARPPKPTEVLLLLPAAAVGQGHWLTVRPSWAMAVLGRLRLGPSWAFLG